MFDQILQMVKEHLADNPQIAAAVPADQQEALHNEIAQHVAGQVGAGTAGGLLGGESSGGLLGAASGLLGGNAGGLTNALGGGASGLVNTLSEKFGLSPEVSSAISASIPALLQKFNQAPS
jgi:hypothetical protein